MVSHLVRRLLAARWAGYLRDYSILKNEGKPFFPYAVAKDGAMVVIVMAVIIFLTLMFGAELGPKADPTTATYVPRPDWNFFFLFEVMRVMRNVRKFTPMATIGVPTICMILLFLLPFYDRSPERRIERRPIALAAGITTIAAMALGTGRESTERAIRAGVRGLVRRERRSMLPAGPSRRRQEAGGCPPDERSRCGPSPAVPPSCSPGAGRRFPGPTGSHRGD